MVFDERVANDGEIKGKVKGDGGGVTRTKEKQRGVGGQSLQKKVDKRMERWFLSFSMPFTPDKR